MATAQTPNGGNQLALTPAQIMQLPLQQQQAYVASLSPSMQAIYQTEMVNMGNMDFMRNSQERPVFNPVQGGSGVTATYTPGTTLNFDFPEVPGYAKGLLIKYSLTVTPATGTNATYQLTQAANWAIFSRIIVNYGNPQINTHPYFLKVQDQTEGRFRGAQNRVLAGSADSALNTQFVDPTPLVVNTGNTWQGYMYIRLNPISGESPYGLLPLNGVGNHPQLQLTCAPSLYGPDALMNGICSGGSGSGQAVTVTGTVKVDTIVLDGTNQRGDCTEESVRTDGDANHAVLLGELAHPIQYWLDEYLYGENQSGTLANGGYRH